MFQNVKIQISDSNEKATLILWGRSLGDSLAGWCYPPENWNLSNQQTNQPCFPRLYFQAFLFCETGSLTFLWPKLVCVMRIPTQRETALPFGIAQRATALGDSTSIWNSLALGLPIWTHWNKISLCFISVFFFFFIMLLVATSFKNNSDVCIHLENWTGFVNKNECMYLCKNLQFWCLSTCLCMFFSPKTAGEVWKCPVNLSNLFPFHIIGCYNLKKKYWARNTNH